MKNYIFLISISFLHVSTCLNYKCGTSHDYWSSSCGPIGSASSRYCSEGGQLVYNTSCATHFQPGSKGCGVLFMGCQSLCRLKELPCQTGRISFLQDKFSVLVDLESGRIQIPLMRRFGDEGNVVVLLKGFTDTGLALEPTNVEWEWGNNAPKFGQLTIPSSLLGLHRPTWINVELEAQNENNLGHFVSAQVFLSYDEPLSVIKPLSSFQNVSVSDSSKTVILDFQTMGALGDDITDESTNVTLMYVGGNATRHIDFKINATKHVFSFSKNRDMKQTISLQINKNLEYTGRKTIYFYLFNGNGIMIDDHVITIHVEYSVSEDLAPIMNRKREALPWTDDITDVYARDRFVSDWAPYYISPGQVIVDIGELCPLILSVYSGKFRIESHLPGLNQQRYLKRGELIGALSAINMRRSPMRIVARSHGILYAISPRVLRIHANEIRDVNILKIMKTEFLRSIIVNANHKSPIVLIPGLMSTRLQAWQRKDCLGVDVEVLDQMWLNLEKVMQTLVVEEACWMDCVRLEKGQRDPQDCKVRAMTGISAISELHEELKGITTIFRSVISLLANKWGYDSTSILPIPYDWRLSPDMLESRDSLFSHMKLQIEHMVAIHKLPCILIGHSMGNNVVDYFVAWMKIHYPNNYEKWFTDNIVAHYSIAAPMAGSIKAFLSTVLGDPNGLPFTFYQARKMISSCGSSLWLLPRNDSIEGREDINLNTLKFQREIPSTEAHESTSLNLDYCDSFSPFEDERANTEKCQEKGVKDEKTNKIKRPTAWPDNFATFRFGDGYVKNISIHDISSGDVWRLLAERANDSLASNSHDIMMNNFLGIPNQSLNPLAQPPSRPPIKHVAMIYGVDVTGPYHLSFTHDGVSKSFELKQMNQESARGILVDGTGSIVGSTGLRRSGDGTVPYASLSWAHSWHLNDDVKIAHTTSRVVEYYEHLLGKWGERTVFSIMNTEEPEYDRFDSVKGQYKTTIIEVVGLEHRDAVRNPFAIQLLDNLLEELVAATFDDDSDHPKVVSTGPDDEPNHIGIEELVDELIELEIVHRKQKNNIHVED